MHVLAPDFQFQDFSLVNIQFLKGLAAEEEMFSQCCVAFRRDPFKTIAEDTTFDLSEVKALHIDFMRLSKGLDVVRKQDFLTGSNYTDEGCLHIAGRIFDEMDDSHKGFLTFAEVAHAISYFIRFILRLGTREHLRVSYTFRVYDWKQQGFLDLDDMKKTILYTDSILLKVTPWSLDRIGPARFSEIDLNEDGQITWEEWRNYYRYDRLGNLDPLVDLCVEIIGLIFPTVKSFKLVKEYADRKVGISSSDEAPPSGVINPPGSGTNLVEASSTVVNPPGQYGSSSGGESTVVTNSLGEASSIVVNPPGQAGSSSGETSSSVTNLTNPLGAGSSSGKSSSSVTNPTNPTGQSSDPGEASLSVNNPINPPESQTR